MRNTQGEFVWYELITTDPDGAREFYDAVVGWQVEDSSQFPNGYRMIGRGDGKSAGGVLPLTEEMRGHGARPVWLGYIGVDDVDSVVAAISGDGGSAMMAPFDIPGVGRVAMVADPDGAPFYVMRGASDDHSDVFSVDQPQRVRWNELSTSDPARAVGFYTRHFGWVQNGDMDMGEMGKYQFIEAGGVMIGAIMPQMPQMPVSMWTYYIGVDDIDRAAAAVADGGGSILNGPMEIPGGEYALNAVDPQGASFGLVGPRKN